ncbi:ribose-phosphate diphosphokinase [Staphylococcus massiliensis]|uniref:Ribose-phosphate pyrophosphokinase n=1 Tax=Staphylococcus massiliensis S46 TaxID=1229783 RepID=K9AJ75_9STAP|nr:ribose-phosphate diphosphokinase [Staphylococcus massiliensis]EKU46156.1 ribose-phosphate pyrophosphokinase [Staphylococcus massiliensis S46]MCG3400537.1 ribose-phosphate diphosphokinase [Staphylococcus massiliensis]MCG3402805.1 ribose-phosphate diphosphokinase [Staphylococcus massiliensis]MCG3413202.1 ribose-phosphate diphosphokinase [Staphylococcus massiliensis]POA01953.1 ribose-phosphate pyrophosphokinase [Staphylococcus massiliensis CCUG 55927]
MLNTEYKNSSLKIFSLKGNEPLAQEVADHVGIDLGKCSVKRFSDGEIQINIEESIRGCDVFIIQPTSNPVNDHLMELLIMIDACKRASAANINIVVPYYGYARQDRKARSREPITAKLVANLIEKAGATRMIALDLHAPQIQGFFDIPIDHLMGVPILADYFENDTDIDLEECVVVSPDHGGVTRARKLADILKTPIAIIDKRRPKPNVAEVMNIVGEIEGRTAIIIDDIIDTAGTITLAAQALVDKGAKDVYACCSHPVLSGPAKERIEDSVIKELIVTNSIKLGDEQKPNNIKELSIANLLAQAIVRVYEDESVSVLFD